MLLDDYKSSSVNKVEMQNICSKFQSAVLRVHLQNCQEIRGF